MDTNANEIVIKGEGIQAMHELWHAAREFKYAKKHCSCMPRDIAKCQELAEVIVKALDRILT